MNTMNLLQKLKQTFWIANILAVLVIFAILLPGSRRMSSSDSGAKESAGSALALVPVELSDLLRHNPFRPLIAPPAPPKVVPVLAPPMPPPPPKIPISQKASRLHLVGIINGDPIQAVVEDAQTHTTLYLTTGQSIGDIRIEKILSDHIVLASDDDHMDLAL